MTAGETQITQAEIPAQAMELIRLYEEAANGYATPSVGWQFAQSDYFVYAYLAAYGDIEAYQQQFWTELLDILAFDPAPPADETENDADENEIV